MLFPSYALGTRDGRRTRHSPAGIGNDSAVRRITAKGITGRLRAEPDDPGAGVGAGGLMRPVGNARVAAQDGERRQVEEFLQRDEQRPIRLRRAFEIGVRGAGRTLTLIW